MADTVAELKGQRDTVKTHLQDPKSSWSRIGSAFAVYGITPDDWQNPDRLKEVDPFLTPDEKELLRRLSENYLHEADDSRARLAATPPTP